MQNLTKKIVIALFLGIAIGLGLNMFAPSAFGPIDTYFFTPLGENLSTVDSNVSCTNCFRITRHRDSFTG